MLRLQQARIGNGRWSRRSCIFGNLRSGKWYSGYCAGTWGRTGWTKTTETGAEAVATITSVSGAGTLLVTGNMNKAATAAAWEGIVTSNRKT